MRLSPCTSAMGSYTKDPLEAKPSPPQLVYSSCPHVDSGLCKGDKLYGYTQASSHRKGDRTDGNKEVDLNWAQQGSMSKQAMTMTVHFKPIKSTVWNQGGGNHSWFFQGTRS